MSEIKSFNFKVKKQVFEFKFTSDEVELSFPKPRLRFRKKDFRYVYVGRLGDKAEWFISYEERGVSKVYHKVADRWDDPEFIGFIDELRQLREGSDISSMSFEDMCDKLKPSFNSDIKYVVGLFGFVSFIVLLAFGSIYKDLSPHANDEGLAELRLEELGSRIDSLETSNLVLHDVMVGSTFYRQVIGSSGQDKRIRYRYFHPIYPSTVAQDYTLQAVLVYQGKNRSNIPELDDVDSIQGILRTAGR